MVRVTVINEAGEEIVIQEGNAGIYREVQRIKKGGNHVVSVDKNATYREFLCVESNSGLTVTLTSGDCIDYSEVRIKYDTTSSERKLYFVPTPRKTRGITEATTVANIGKTVKEINVPSPSAPSRPGTSTLCDANTSFGVDIINSFSCTLSVYR